MKTFVLIRNADFSGVSGTGIVLEGIVFSSGKCVVNWLTPLPYGSINVFDSFEMFEKIHITSHPTNESVIQWRVA